MKVAIIGSRSITSANIGAHIPAGTTCIISGGARGVDTLAAEYARANNIPLQVFLPDYARYGKAAPIMRNNLIIEACDMLIAFWNGKSRGTAYTFQSANRLGKAVRVIQL